MSDEFAVSVQQWENFQFLIDFNQDGVADLLTDEEQPVGEGKGPDPSRLLAAAVGNCLSSSLLFCLRKAKVETHGLGCVVEGNMVRDERGRLRIHELRVKLEPKLAEADASRISRCAQIFEDFCIVTQSVRHGIDVQIDLAPETVQPGELPVM